MPPDRPRARAPDPWQLTDDAIAVLEACLLAHPPERGGALLGPAGHRLITHVLPDPEPGTPAGYANSPALQEILTAVLDHRCDLAYRGTAHSHPGSMTEPSPQDLLAFRAVLEANSTLSPLLFPIAVGRSMSAPTEPTEPAASWTTDHVVALGSGSLAAYTQSTDQRSVVPVALSVLAVRAAATALGAGRGLTPREAGSVREPMTGAL